MACCAPHCRLCQFGVKVSWFAKPLPACYASALICPLIFESLTLSKEGATLKCPPPSDEVRFVPRREGKIISTICQETSMISMLPEKLDCLPILPSSSRVRVSEIPSSNSIWQLRRLNCLSAAGPPESRWSL